MSENLVQNNMLVASASPPRFTLNEWYLNNRVKYRFVNDQQRLADRILAQNEIVCDKTAEQTVLNRNETNHLLNERLSQIEFQKQETELFRKKVLLEIEALDTYQNRIMDAIDNIKMGPLEICKKCILIREQRIGIDLVHDDVEQELLKENEVIGGVLMLLYRTLEQGKEQLRRLRSTIYYINRDLEDKTHALKIDNHNVKLKETNLNLSVYQGLVDLANSEISLIEWNNVTARNLEDASKEMNAGTQLRTYIDILLNQANEDLRNQCDNVNTAFRRRISETAEAKTKLELQHYETVRQINEMNRSITKLQKALADKEGFVALAHTRLGNRSQRPGIELCKDLVETHLFNEVNQLNQNCTTLQQTLTEAQASQRFLLKTQIQLEEEMNMKTNTLKIDEVECMTLRQNMVYHPY